MARFPAYGGPGEGAHRFGGSGLGTPPPGLPGGNVSFTVGGPTLQALQERQQRLQQAAPELPGPAGMQSPWQGASYLANTFVNSLQQNRAAAEEERGQQEMAQALSTGIDPVTGQLKPEAMATVMARNPEVGLQFIGDMIKSRRDKVETLTGPEAAARGLDPTRTWQVDSSGKANDITPTGGESYGPVITGEAAKAAGLDPAKSYQLNQQSGQYDQVGGGGTSVTINPPSAETAAKIGLANGFLDNYDSVLASAQAGEMTGSGYVTSVGLGRGNGGAQYRNLLQGTEAMVRLLTGAGMSENEAKSRVKQFEPQITDDAPTLVSKIQGLKQALENVKKGVATRGQDETAEPDTPVPADAVPAPEDLSQYQVGKTYVFEDGSVATYTGKGANPQDMPAPDNWLIIKEGGK